MGGSVAPVPSAISTSVAGDSTVADADAMARNDRISSESPSMKTRCGLAPLKAGVAAMACTACTWAAVSASAFPAGMSTTHGGPLMCITMIFPLTPRRRA
jgi:hypothetical protein